MHFNIAGGKQGQFSCWLAFCLVSSSKMIVCLCDVRVWCVGSGVDWSSHELLYLSGIGEPTGEKGRGVRQLHDSECREGRAYSCLGSPDELRKHQGSLAEEPGLSWDQWMEPRAGMAMGQVRRKTCGTQQRWGMLGNSVQHRTGWGAAWLRDGAGPAAAACSLCCSQRTAQSRIVSWLQMLLL